MSERPGGSSRGMGQHWDHLEEPVPRHVLILADPKDEGSLLDITGRKATRAEITVAVGTGDFAQLLASVPFDLIMVRGDFPGFDPHEALQVWRETGSQAPFIILTAPGTEEIAAACAREGCIVIPLDVLPRVPALVPGLPASAMPGDGLPYIKSEIARMESVAKLASRIAHEIRNPLTMLLMGIEYLGRRLGGADAEIRGALKDMEAAVLRANSVVHGLIDLAATGTLELRPEPIIPVIEEALMPMEAQLGSGGIRLVRDLDPSLPLVRLDRSRMVDVFGRVLRYAARRLPRGGEIRVRATALKGADGNTIDEHVVVVDIEDTASPLAESDLEKMFDPVRSPGTPGNEVAQGMPLVREIVELQGGAIVARNHSSAPGLVVSISLRADGGRRPQVSGDDIP